MEIRTKVKVTLIVSVSIALIICGTAAYFNYNDLTLRRIVSDSMEPALYKNDICIIKKCKTDEVEIGNIICLRTEKGDVVHRVVVKTNKNRATQLYTKGDNNNYDDELPTNDYNIIGKVTKILSLKKRQE